VGTAAHQQSRDQVEADRPHELVERDRLEHRVAAEEHGRAQHEQCGQELSETVASQLAGDQATEDHDHGASNRWPDPQPHQRVAEDQRRQPRHHGGERRIVDVTEARVLPRGEVVQLVALEPVPACRGKLRHQFDQRQSHQREHPVLAPALKHRHPTCWQREPPTSPPHPRCLQRPRHAPEPSAPAGDALDKYAPRDGLGEAAPAGDAPGGGASAGGLGRGAWGWRSMAASCRAARTRGDLAARYGPKGRASSASLGNQRVALEGEAMGVSPSRGRSGPPRKGRTCGPDADGGAVPLATSRRPAERNNL
jgi:hypothetical protein